ncbi:MAG: hypothetical protein FWG11_07960 [Promicromonosporaceae bacterium]|nr:hypothetical protein [Promicromonosporaceae bacterium]
MRTGVALVAVALLAGACAPATGEPYSSPWAAEFAEVYARAESDLVRAIVADGELTLAEMREAIAATNACFRDVEVEFGVVGTVETTLAEDGLGGFTLRTGHVEPWHDVDQELRSAIADCEFRYWNDLWILWDLIRLNPDAEDFDGLVLDCLVRNSVVPQGFTYHQFREAVDQCAFVYDHDPEHPLSPEELRLLWEQHDRDCRPQLPDGTYLDEGAAWDCQMDPLNH